MTSANGLARFLLILPNSVAAVFDRRKSRKGASRSPSGGLKTVTPSLRRSESAARGNCNPIKRSYRSARMKYARACAVSLSLSVCFRLFGGTPETQVESVRSDFDPQRFDFAIESAYLLGAINAPAGYEIGAEFLTARIRWGVIHETWLRGYHQFYVSAMAEPIFRGIENYYFGFNLGFRYNFVPRGSRFAPYISGGVGGGWIDSHANIPGAQGQDFTFNILSAAGISYMLNDQWKLEVGALYQHLSNGGQTDPNPSLNLFGPQVGITYSF
jgi:opacity protein-like surface antigen